VNSPILRTAVRVFLPLLLMFSVIVFLRGHNEPGGGFIGGLIAAAGLALHSMAFSPKATRRLLRVDLHRLAAVGLIISAASGLPALAMGEPFMEAKWATLSVPWLGEVKVGTPLAFDLGVYFLVVAITMTMVLTMAEE